MNENATNELLNNTVSTVEEFVLHLNSLIQKCEDRNKGKIWVDVVVLQMAVSLLNLEKSMLKGYYEWGKMNGEVVEELSARFLRALESKQAARLPTEPKTQRKKWENPLFDTREEASDVLEAMRKIINNYEMVTVGDLLELIGWVKVHDDDKWGWTDLSTAFFKVDTNEVGKVTLVLPEPKLIN